MRRTRPHARVLAVLILLAIPFAAFGVTGQVVYTEGDVSRQSGRQKQDAAIGDPVGAGDVITTGPRSVAVIDLDQRHDAEAQGKDHACHRLHR